MIGAGAAMASDAAVALWPAALTMAVVMVRERRREHRRRRSLNEALHELRRPLQALVLTHRRPGGRSPDPLDLALAALRDLDARVNERPRADRPRLVDTRALVISAADRWRARAARSARALRVEWTCGSAEAVVDPMRFAQALDNLIVNALEHGRGPVRILGARRGGRLVISVRDGGATTVERLRSHPDRRRGYGLRVAAGIASRHGGALRLGRGAGGTVATLELPLASAPPSPKDER